MPNHKQYLGKKGESIAKAYLEKKQYQIIAKNWRSSNQEIDLIALKNQTLIFIEVKTRSGEKFGHPEEAVGQKKQKQILKAADAFLQQSELSIKDIRFDIISILLENQAEKVQHFEDAFYPGWT